jgi:hypothetical protein
MEVVRCLRKGFPFRDENPCALRPADVRTITVVEASMRAWFAGLQCAALAGTLLASTTPANAQDDEEEKPKHAVTPAPVVAPVVAADDGRKDHDRVVGHFGFGFFGISDVPLPGESVTTPVIGARYWLQPDMGIDIGLGLHYDTGSTSNGDTSTDKASKGAVLVHGGLPFALSTAKHFTFVFVPEINLGYASSTVKGTAVAGAPSAGDTGRTGLRVDLGARIGAEIHFGFMGIPELSLEGSVGAFFTYRKTTFSPPNTGSTTDSETLLTTTSFNNPWDFFRTSIAARYYW